jgi:hypothetical protein
MGNFKNAKEFDRTELYNSEIFAKLSKTSGKSLGERWKDRRQSDNVVDRRIGDDLGHIIRAEAESSNFPDGGPDPQPKKKPKKPQPKSTSKSDRLKMTQVTPGKWITK